MVYKLSARKSHWGPGVSEVEPHSKGISDDDPVKSGWKDLNFFVHGFNNDSGRMESVWDNTLQQLRRRSDFDQRYLKNLVLLYWPGELFRSSLLAAPFYSLMVKDAKKTAVKLSEYLIDYANKYDGIRINFVGHSLGCLVILETLRLLQKTNVAVGRVLLMAAAVQVGRCLPSLAYGSKFAEDYEEVLISSKDRVLQWCFPVGQLGANDYSTLNSAAVGRWGGPVKRWRNVTGDTGYGHGDYWKEKAALNRVVNLLKGGGLPAYPPLRLVKEKNLKEYPGPPGRQSAERKK